MNVHLRKHLAFSSGLCYKGHFFINHYDVGVDLLTVSDDLQQQNIAYDRMKLWISDVINNSVMLSAHDPDLPVWQSTAARTLVLPQDPVDQLVGIMLHLKLNAIMEDHMLITALEISSTEGDGMIYLHHHDDAVGPDFAQPGWWSQPTPAWCDPPKKPTGKVIDLARQPEWADFGLGWSQHEPEQEQDQSVVFAEFGRHADQ